MLRRGNERTISISITMTYRPCSILRKCFKDISNRDLIQRSNDSDKFTLTYARDSPST